MQTHRTVCRSNELYLAIRLAPARETRAHCRAVAGTPTPKRAVRIRPPKWHTILAGKFHVYKRPNSTRQGVSNSDMSRSWTTRISARQPWRLKCPVNVGSAIAQAYPVQCGPLSDFEAGFARR